MIRRTARKDRIEPRHRQDPIESTEPAEPIDPTDSTDPIEPMLSTDPREAMDSVLSLDHNDHLELPVSMPAIFASTDQFAAWTVSELVMPVRDASMWR